MRQTVWQGIGLFWTAVARAMATYRYWRRTLSSDDVYMTPGWVAHWQRLDHVDRRRT
jgi:hypothetical protein